MKRSMAFSYRKESVVFCPLQKFIWPFRLLSYGNFTINFHALKHDLKMCLTYMQAFKPHKQFILLLSFILGISKTRNISQELYQSQYELQLYLRPPCYFKLTFQKNKIIDLNCFDIKFNVVMIKRQNKRVTPSQ